MGKKPKSAKLDETSASEHQGHVPADYMRCTNEACSVHGFSGADVPSGKCPACGSKLVAALDQALAKAAKAAEEKAERNGATPELAAAPLPHAAGAPEVA